MNKIFSVFFCTVFIIWSIYSDFLYPIDIDFKKINHLNCGNIHNVILGLFWVYSAFSTNKKSFVFFVPALFLFSFFVNNGVRSDLGWKLDMLINVLFYFISTLLVFLLYPKIFKAKKNEKTNTV